MLSVREDAHCELPNRTTARTQPNCATATAKPESLKTVCTGLRTVTAVLRDSRSRCTYRRGSVRRVHPVLHRAVHACPDSRLRATFESNSSLSHTVPSRLAALRPVTPIRLRRCASFNRPWRIVSYESEHCVARYRQPTVAVYAERRRYRARRT